MGAYSELTDGGLFNIDRRPTTSVCTSSVQLIEVDNLFRIIKNVRSSRDFCWLFNNYYFTYVSVAGFDRMSITNKCHYKYTCCVSLFAIEIVY